MRRYLKPYLEPYGDIDPDVQPRQRIWMFVLYEIEQMHFEKAISRIPGAAEALQDLVTLTYDPATTPPPTPTPLDMPDGYPY